MCQMFALLGAFVIRGSELITLEKASVVYYQEIRVQRVRRAVGVRGSKQQRERI